MTCPHGEIPDGAAGCVDCMIAVVEAAREIDAAELVTFGAIVRMSTLSADYHVVRWDQARAKLRDALRALDGGKIE